MEGLKLRKESATKENAAAKDFLEISRNKDRIAELSILRNITISTIIFDLSEVQITGLLGVEKKLGTLLGKTPIEISAALIGDDLNSFFHGKISEDEYLHRTIRKNNWRVDTGQLKKIIRENFAEIEGTRKIIERLKRQGFKLGLLSVHGKEWIEYASGKFDYHKLFDVVLYSFEIAVSKPDRKAYEIIIEKLGVKPQECMFVDNSPENLLPAKALGMKTVLFKSADQLEAELRRIGLFKD